MKSYEVMMNISIEDAVVVEAENEEEARRKAYPCGHSGVYHWYITEVECLDEKEQQYDVVLTINTKAKSVAEAMEIARQKVAEGKDFYLEVEKNGHREFDGHIADVKFEEVKHED